jgi:hypothetical protein
MGTRWQLVTLAVLWLAFLAYVAQSAGELPARVASHFDFQGRPNDFMGRTGYLFFMAGFGCLFPGLMPGIALFLRRTRAKLNLPNRDYWLAPERRDETYAYFFRHSLWFAVLSLAFVAGLHQLVIEANAVQPPHLSNSGIGALAGLFLAGIVAWSISLVVHFSRPGDFGPSRI